MKKGFEERLLELSGVEELKAGKQLLKLKLLLGAWRDRQGRLCGCFKQEAGEICCTVVTGENPVSQCSCASDTGRLCSHAVALIFYAGQYNPIFLQKGKEEAAKYYGGLKQQSLQQLAARSQKPSARVFIEAHSAFPHVPSKWENASLAVRLRTAAKEYLGNLNNLRQLYFDKSLTVVLKYEHFSLQDQQIIRFLATQGEAENSQILLNAESTAEFFHCLIGFPRFIREGRQLKINDGNAEPVLIRNGNRLTPGICYDNAILSTGGAKVITGRAGCWIGREGEYFFIPATNEISYLRNFFRAKEQTPPAGMSMEDFLRDFPLRIVDAKNADPETRQGSILLDGDFADADEFRLKVRYLYDAAGSLGAYPPESGRLVREKDHFWRRDEETERAFENNLRLFGFVDEDGTYVLKSADRIGTFLNRALPEFMAAIPRFSLAGKLAALLRGVDGLPELKLKCSLLAVKPKSFVVRYELTGAGVNAPWKSCSDVVRSGSSFLYLPGGGMIHISPALKRFFPAAAPVLRNLDMDGCTFEVPFHQCAYYVYLVRDIPGALIPEIAAGPENTYSAGDGPDFKFQGELRSYQKEGVRFFQRMTDRDLNVILADEMGLGKTIQTLAFLATRQKRDMPPALIICPASLVTNWEREAHKFVPDFRVAAPRGGERAELWRTLKQYDLVILSYAAARFSADKLKHVSFSYLVLDEAQHIKNPGSCNAKNSKSIEAQHRIVLSGTPLENSQEDLWSIMDFLHPGILGTLPAFRKRYAQINEDENLRSELAAQVGPFIKRRTKAQVAADLPPKSEHILYCDMLPEQRKLYEKIRLEGQLQLARLDDRDVHANAAVFTTLLRLRQICCHPELLPDEQGKGIPSAKTELLFELLQENIDSQHKMLLFSQFTTLLGLITAELDKDGIPFEYLDGSTRNRQQRVDNFNNSPDIPLFLLSLKAGGTGLNLTSADTVIIYDPWWNPAAELQAADRTHRIGQEHPVSAIKLVMRDSIEEKILQLQARKQELFNAVVDSGESSKLSIDDLRFLLQ
ncbi:MAG: DEAD/DEAH box helicase [Lentisphaeria bacterium]|nr:DEAD/DEAH box helicase [Lentisphaeria bacterium]